MSSHDIVEKLQGFIHNELLIDDVEVDDDLLVDAGVDSLGMFRMVAFIEASFDVEVSPMEFTIENFQTLNLVAAFVHRLQAQAS